MKNLIYIISGFVNHINLTRSIIVAALLIPLANHAQTTTENHVKETVYQKETTSGLGIADDDKIESITYYDGLGRPIQQLAKQAGGNRQDIITTSVYDPLGRQSKQYLPYADANQTQPSLDFINQTALMTNLEAYYAIKFPNDANSGTANPFSETIFDNGSSGIVLEQGAPGEAWLADTTSDSDHTIKFVYDTNGTDEVGRFRVMFPTGNTEQPQPFYDGFYNENELSKTITKDENWQPDSDPNNPNLDHTTEEFKDKQGRVVLKRTYNNNAKHDTHYIYDDFGNLTYVLSPSGSDAILTTNTYTAFSQNIKSYQFIDADKYGNPVVGSSGDLTIVLDNSANTMSFNFNINYASATELLNGPIDALNYAVPDMIIGTINDSGASYIVSIQDNFLHLSGSGLVTQITDSFVVNLPAYSVDATVMDDLCYQYHYDYRNRLIEKKIPGKDWESIIYDKLDRPVLTQDALLKQNNEWLFTKYDALGRVTYTGKLLDINNNRSELQVILNTQTQLYEERNSGTTVAGTNINYTNQAFPTQNVIDVLTVNYYDDYTDTDGLSVPAQNSYGHTTSANIKSLPSVSKIRVLDTNNWITTVTGYDDKARPIYAATKNNYLNTTDTVDTNIDFVGKVLQTTTVHTKTGHPTVTTIDDFTYDHAERLLSQKQEIVGQSQERIVENYYDELGQLEKKDVGGETVFDGYTDIVGVTVSLDANNDTIITKTLNSDDWDAGIATKGKISGDGYIEFIAVGTNKLIMAGLSHVNTDSHYNTIEYAIYLRNNGKINVFENGINKGNFGYYQADDTVRVERIGTTIYYKHNGTTIYTSQMASTESLLGDASIHDVFGKVKNLNIESSNLNTVLQTVDYTYNIRGWLKGINDIDDLDEDLFSFKLNYNSPTQGTALYNGNISEALWQTANDDMANVDSRSYFYTYDALNRITKGVFSAVGTPTNTNGDYNLQHVDYDKNGNIGVLRRNGLDDNDTLIQGYMDNLTYTYDGNQLKGIKELGSTTYGFKEVNGPQTIDYTYDANGNMLTDANKGITNISYNHLNLPTKVVTSNGNITYIYDASGIKLKKLVNETGQSTIATLYAGNFIYEDNASGEVLKFFSQPEGYTEPVDESDLSLGFNYIYQYKDHLGNIRLSYSDTNKDGAIGTGEIIEENNYYPFGLKHKGYNNAVSANSNSVASKFKYNGIELEESLGIDLYEMDLRAYDPAIARWTSIDLVTHHSMSTYNAFDNNPIFWADPSGANSKLGGIVKWSEKGEEAGAIALAELDYEYNKSSSKKKKKSSKEESSKKEKSAKPDDIIIRTLNPDTGEYEDAYIIKSDIYNVTFDFDASVNAIQYPIVNTNKTIIIYGFDMLAWVLGYPDAIKATFTADFAIAAGTGGSWDQVAFLRGPDKGRVFEYVPSKVDMNLFVGAGVSFELGLIYSDVDINRFNKNTLTGNEWNTNISFGFGSINKFTGTSGRNGFSKHDKKMYHGFTVGIGLGAPSLILSLNESKIND